jgi:hypothetical protein
MQGVNENAQEHTSKFTALVERFQRDLGCHVLGLHHSGHENEDRARGSSVFKADTDTDFVVKLTKDKERVAAITMTKQKDGEEWSQPLVLKLAKTGEGDDETLVVARPGLLDMPAPAATKSSVKEPAIVALALHVLNDLKPHEHSIRNGGQDYAKEWTDYSLAVAVRRAGQERGVPEHELPARSALHNDWFGQRKSRRKGRDGEYIAGRLRKHPDLAAYFDKAAEKWRTPLTPPPIPDHYRRWLDDHPPNVADLSERRTRKVRKET